MNCVARHVPAVDAIRGRCQYAADDIARIDIFQRDFAIGALVVVGDAFAQEHADILQLRIAALVGARGVGVVGHQLLGRAFRDYDHGVAFACQYPIEIAEHAAFAFQSSLDLGDEHQVHVGGCECCLTGDETGVPPHQFDQADAVARPHCFDARAAYHVHRRRIRAFEAKAAIDEMDVVVDGLRHADDRDLQAAPFYFRRELHRCADGAVAADHEQDVDGVGLEIVDHFAGILRAARRAEDGAALVMDVRHRLRGQLDRFMAEARNQAFVSITKAEDAFDAVTARELEHDAAHDVVDAGAEAAAGDDAAANRSRIEENLVARAGQFEGGQGGRLTGMGADDRHAVVDQHLFCSAHEHDGAFAQVGNDRRGKQALAEVPDGDVGRCDVASQRGRAGQLDRGRSGFFSGGNGAHAWFPGWMVGRWRCIAHQPGAASTIAEACFHRRVTAHGRGVKPQQRTLAGHPEGSDVQDPPIMLQGTCKSPLLSGKTEEKPRLPA